MTAGPVVEEPTAADPRAALLAELAVIRCRLRGEEPRLQTAPPDPRRWTRWRPGSA